MLNLSLSELVAAGAELAERVAEYEGRIANPALDRWQAAVAETRSDKPSAADARQSWEADLGHDSHKQGGGA